MRQRICIRDIYTLTTALVEYCNDGIVRDLRLSIEGDNLEEAISRLCHSMGISAAISNLDYNAVSHVAVVLAKCCTNPNIYVIGLDGMPHTPTFDLSTLTGCLVLQEIFPSTFLERDARLYVNNYVARFIMEYCVPSTVILPEQLDFSTMSLEAWFYNEDKMAILYLHFNLLPISVQNFLAAYVGADTHETMRQFHPELQDHCLFLPYAGSRRVGDLVLMNFWNEGNDDTETRYLIQPVLPYPYDEIMTWSGAEHSYIENWLIWLN